jgi:hypothetical protein
MNQPANQTNNNSKLNREYYMYLSRSPTEQLQTRHIPQGMQSKDILFKRVIGYQRNCILIYFIALTVPNILSIYKLYSRRAP